MTSAGNAKVDEERVGDERLSTRQRRRLTFPPCFGSEALAHAPALTTGSRSQSPLRKWQASAKQNEPGFMGDANPKYHTRVRGQPQTRLAESPMALTQVAQDCLLT